jgi:hypothetical protein
MEYQKAILLPYPLPHERFHYCKEYSFIPMVRDFKIPITRVFNANHRVLNLMHFEHVVDWHGVSACILYVIYILYFFSLHGLLCFNYFFPFSCARTPLGNKVREHWWRHATQ